MDLKLRASLFAICLAGILAGCKLLIGLVSGSMAVVSSGVDSLLDVSMSAMNFMAIRKAGQPADPTHPYGHGKVENLAAGIQSLVILLSGSFIIWFCIHKFIEFQPIRYSPLDLGVMVLSLGFSFFISARLKKTGAATGSQALKADALHYASDLYSNAAAILAMILTHFTGTNFFDLLFATVAGIIIIYSAGAILKKAIRGLMDSGIPPAVEAELVAIIQNTPYPFAGFHNLRTRYSGSQIFADLHLLFCRKLNVEEAHEEARRLERRITDKIPSLDLLSHIEPCEEPCDLTPEDCKIKGPVKPSGKGHRHSQETGAP